MADLIFVCEDSSMSRKVVNFWNPYCRGVGNMRGDAEVYVIEYNSYYGIEGYKAYDSEGEAIGYYHDYRVYKDLPAFMEFPEAVRKEMIARSSSKSPVPFILDISRSDNGGGFTWGNTVEGHDFWHNIIRDRDFDLFYRQFNGKHYESRLCNEETPLGGDSEQITSGIRSRFNKARVTVKPLSHKEVIGRG